MKFIVKLPSFSLMFVMALSACSEKAPTRVLSYNENVGALLNARCANCHFDGGVAPFALETYEQVYNQRYAIKTAVLNETMPPWQPADDCNEYQGDFSLTAEQINSIVEWVDEGAQEGKAVADVEESTSASADSLVNESEEVAGITRIDLSMQMPQGYQPELFPDDYRCFLLDWPETEITHVTGFYAEPGNMKIVHHVIAFLISPEHVAEYEAMDAESEAPGYTCFGGPGGDPSSATGWIGAWAPGDVGGNTPPGTGIPVEPGSKIALQVHYDAGLFEEGMLDQTTVHFKLDDTVEKPAFVLPFTNYQWLGGSGMEIPAGKKSVSHNHLFDPTPFLGWSMLSDGLIPSNTAFEIHSAGLHMHELGKKIKVEIHRQNGDRSCLLQIDEWDFNWQGGYTLENFNVFEPGDKLYIECEWDNSAENQRVIDGEQQEPRNVHWGEGTSDEMCLAILYITPH